MFCRVQCSSSIFQLGGTRYVESTGNLERKEDPLFSLQLLLLTEDSIACIDMQTSFALKKETHQVV